MNYEEVKNTISQLLDSNYEDVIKSVISIEKGIEDKDVLDQVYSAFMKDDSMTGLLHSDFDAMIEAIQEEKAQLSSDSLEVIGNVTKDVTMKTLKGEGDKDFQVANFSVVKRDQDGNKHYTSVTAYNQRADKASQLKKGDFVKLTGQMKYDEHDGKLYKTLVVKSIQVLKTRQQQLEDKANKPSTLGAIKEMTQQAKQDQSNKSKPNKDKDQVL
ncbi:TPA: single-stranded DNA-binding protein [Streptococcus suis]